MTTVQEALDRASGKEAIRKENPAFGLLRFAVKAQDVLKKGVLLLPVAVSYEPKANGIKRKLT